MTLRERVEKLADELAEQGRLGRPHGRGKALAAAALRALLAEDAAPGCPGVFVEYPCGRKPVSGSRYCAEHGGAPPRGAEHQHEWDTDCSYGPPFCKRCGIPKPRGVGEGEG